MKKNLIFHYWLPNNGLPKIPYLIHYHCLREFIDIFDNVVFVIACDDLNNINLISQLRSQLSQLPIKGELTFKLVQNDSMGESNTAYNEIYSKLDELEGITYYTHTKSFSNYDNNPFNNSHWIIAMYYFNLIQSEVAHFEFITGKFGTVTKGTLLFRENSVKNLNHWMYSGASYWVNTRLLSHIIKTENLYFPKPCDRGYSENILGDILEFNLSRVQITQDCNWFEYLPDAYNETPDMIRVQCDDNLYNNYLEFYNKIMNLVGE